ncbi:hypothetical protein SNEBB_010200 [Seison nebaliae]|nr:hypothetical protein SNEBB_010200 [Seison nebaliae]
MENKNNGNSYIKISTKLNGRLVYDAYENGFSCHTDELVVPRDKIFDISCTKVNNVYQIIETRLLGRMLKTDSKSLPDRWADGNDFDTDDDIKQDLTRSYKSPLVVTSMDKFKYIQLDIHTNNLLKLRMVFHNDGSKSTNTWFTPDNLYQVFGPYGNDVYAYQMNLIKVPYLVDTFFKTPEDHVDRQIYWVKSYAGCPNDPLTIGVVGNSDTCKEDYSPSVTNNYYIIYSRGPGPMNAAGYRFGDALSIFGITD